jgi:hypothetical protein
MKAISIYQPWASFIAHGYKQYETRSWTTSYRGDILICSGTKKTIPNKSHFDYLKENKFPDSLGKIPSWNIQNKNYCNGYTHYDELLFGYGLCIANLVDCIMINDLFVSHQTELEKSVGDWSTGHYAWKLDNIRLIQPVLVKGKQRLFDIDIRPIHI